MSLNSVRSVFRQIGPPKSCFVFAQHTIFVMVCVMSSWEHRRRQECTHSQQPSPVRVDSAPPLPPPPPPPPAIHAVSIYRVRPRARGVIATAIAIAIAIAAAAAAAAAVGMCGNGEVRFDCHRQANLW